MSDLFFYDSLNDVAYTWSRLIDDLNRADRYNPYCYSSDYYDIFKTVLLSLLANSDLTLLDYDFSNKELQELGVSEAMRIQTSPLPALEIENVSDLIERTLQSGKWRLTLYTSGTTGLPKQVRHNIKSMTRAVKRGADRKDDVWGFAYNPTHIAGLQVFFQALLNGNAMVNLFRLSRERIFERLLRYRITNLSATPTFFRLLLPADRVFPSLKRITTGGERLDNELLAPLQQMFPNARVLNVYASTEAGTLFASDGDAFTIKEDNRRHIKIDNGELLVHRDLLGESDGFKLDGGWYRTGDLVEVLSDEPLRFRFISRKNEMINVGGYKVNPLEVEATVHTHPKVKNAHVYGKPSKVIGTILLCDVETIGAGVSEKELRGFLQGKLQDFKIPRMFRFVDRIETTRTGKLKRSS